MSQNSTNINGTVVNIRPLGDEEKSFFKTHFENASEIEEKRMILEIEDGNKRGWTAILKTDIAKYGLEYIRTHCSLVFSSFTEEYDVKISYNDWYNDEERFPLMIIDVKFVECVPGENTEIWKCEQTGKYYMRQLCNEPFARWMSCSKKHSRYEDQAEIRANVVFRNGEQLEKVTYNDWNGHAAYKDTFNPCFRAG